MAFDPESDGQGTEMPIPQAEGVNDYQRIKNLPDMFQDDQGIENDMVGSWRLVISMKMRTNCMRLMFMPAASLTPEI